MSSSTIPVVDMRDFHHPQRKQHFVRAVAAAFRELGFVGVVEPGIDRLTLDAGYETAKDFFQSPLSEKLECVHPELSGQRGFVQSESAKGRLEKDIKEFYHISQCDNVWPRNARAPGFQESMEELFQALTRHQCEIQEAISLALGEHQDFLGQRTRNGSTLMRVLYYPATTQAESHSPEAMWAAAHTDINLFTILPKSTADGLEVFDRRTGTWLPVRVPENAFILNCGDMLQNLTNGEFQSCWHRVVQNQSCNQPRYSIVFFVHPREEVDLTPLPQFIRDDSKPKYPRAMQRELLAERLVELGIASKHMEQLFVDSGLSERRLALGQEISREARAAMSNSGHKRVSNL